MSVSFRLRENAKNHKLYKRALRESRNKDKYFPAGVIAMSALPVIVGFMISPLVGIASVVVILILLPSKF